jgi:hypothetical protein
MISWTASPALPRSSMSLGSTLGRLMARCIPAWTMSSRAWSSALAMSVSCCLVSIPNKEDGVGPPEGGGHTVQLNGNEHGTRLARPVSPFHRASGRGFASAGPTDNTCSSDQGRVDGQPIKTAPVASFPHRYRSAQGCSPRCPFDPRYDCGRSVHGQLLGRGVVSPVPLRLDTPW